MRKLSFVKYFLLILFIIGISSIVLTSAKIVKDESSKEERLTWTIYKTVQVEFSTGHRINAFKTKRGNIGHELHIRIDGMSYYDTGTWTDNGGYVTVTEPNTNLWLQVHIGEKTGGLEIYDPPGGGECWIVFAHYNTISALGNLESSDLGYMTWGSTFTAMQTWT